MVPDRPNIQNIELTLLMVCLNEGPNLRSLLPQLKALFSAQGVPFEILIIDGGSKDETWETALQYGCHIAAQTEPGYAHAIWQGIRAAKGKFLILMDGDGSHSAEDAVRLFMERASADIVINSRYVKGGASQGPMMRRVLSRILNWIYRHVLGLPFREISGGFRIYRREIFNTEFVSHSMFYEVQEEMLAVLHWRGHSVVEIPFTYRLRREGNSKASMVRYGFRLLLALIPLRREKKRILSESKKIDRPRADLRAA